MENLKNNDLISSTTAELEALKAKLAETKAKLAAAKKAAAKSRPVRMFTFVTRMCTTKQDALNANGEFVFKSDVHYCAEKAAIDILTEDLKNGQMNEFYYSITKQTKADETETAVEVLWIDSETNQIIIE